MTKLPSLTGREVIKALGKAGFKVVRVRGSHHFLLHTDARRTLFLYIQVKQLDLVC